MFVLCPSLETVRELCTWNGAISGRAAARLPTHTAGRRGRDPNETWKKKKTSLISEGPREPLTAVISELVKNPSSCIIGRANRTTPHARRGQRNSALYYYSWRGRKKKKLQRTRSIHTITNWILLLLLLLLNGIDSETRLARVLRPAAAAAASASAAAQEQPPLCTVVHRRRDRNDFRAKIAIHAAKPNEQSVLKRLFVLQNTRTKQHYHLSYRRVRVNVCRRIRLFFLLLLLFYGRLRLIRARQIINTKRGRDCGGGVITVVHDNGGNVLRAGVHGQNIVVAVVVDRSIDRSPKSGLNPVGVVSELFAAESRGN